MKLFKYLMLGLAAQAGPTPDEEEIVEMCGNVPCSQRRMGGNINPPLIKVIPPEEPEGKV